MKLKLISLLTAFFTASISIGQIKIADLKIDTLITGFHFAADWAGTNVYTPNGKPDLKTKNPSSFSFTIFQNAPYKSALKQIENLIEMSKQDGYTHSDFVKMDTTINEYKVCILSFTETLEGTGYKNLVFDAFIMKDNDAIVFVSGDLNNGIYIDKFKRTFYAIKI